jgi:hypothetical protein
MKTFLAIYLGGADSQKRAAWDNLDGSTRQKQAEAGMKAWHGWMTEHKSALVFEGGPLGKTKKVSDAGIADTKNAMTGFVILRAESHDAAASMFKDHPHFAIFPGDAVEIMECMPIPTM